jgi:hypothetical protein
MLVLVEFKTQAHNKINEKTNEIHISWLMLCAGVTLQLALVCDRKYAS